MKPIGADFGKLGAVMVHIAQHVDSTHQRRCGRHTLEDECVEEGRSPTSDAGIVLAEHLVGIELFRPRQRPGLRDVVRKRSQGITAVIASKASCLVVARAIRAVPTRAYEADLLVDRAAIGLEGSGMPPVGFAEHRPDQPVEQIDGLVRQAGGEIEGDGDQGGMPTLALVARDMLHRGAARFAGEPGKASLMHTMPACRIEAGGADMVQSLDQTEHRHRLRRFRHLAQPGEPALAGFRPALRQRIQPMTLLGREPIGQPALDLATRLIAGLDAEPLERAGRWDDDPAPPALLHHQPGKMGKPVVLDRVRQQPAGQIGSRTRPEGPKPETVLQFGRMAPAVLLRGEIVLDRLRKSVDLLGDKQEKRPRWPFARLQRTARITQIAKHEGVAEAIMITTTAPDRREVRSR